MNARCFFCDNYWPFFWIKGDLLKKKNSVCWNSGSIPMNLIGVAVQIWVQLLRAWWPSPGDLQPALQWFSLRCFRSSGRLHVRNQCSGIGAQSLLFGRWMVCEELNAKPKCPLEILHQCCSKRTQPVLFSPAGVQFRSSENVFWVRRIRCHEIHFNPAFSPFFFSPRWCKIQIRLAKSDWSFSKPCNPFSPLWAEKQRAQTDSNHVLMGQNIYWTFKTKSFIQSIRVWWWRWSLGYSQPPNPQLEVVLAPGKSIIGRFLRWPRMNTELAS